MSPDNFAPSIRPARVEEHAPALRLVFRHLSETERDNRVANALELIRLGELDPQGILVAREKRHLLGAMIFLPVPGASALVWPPQTARTGQNCIIIENRLMQSAASLMRQGGAKLAQALLGPKENYLAAPLLRNGFAHVTRLWYLKHDLVLLPQLRCNSSNLFFQTYADADQPLFHQTLLRTYEQTLDCPEVNGVRAIEEIMEGHRSQGTYEPNRWFLAWGEGEPVGVILLADVPDLQGWDLSYLGVVPQARRCGIGRKLATKALFEARSAGVQHLTLAVDARNLPAWELYHSLGFNVLDQREVFLAIWPPATFPNED